MTTLSNLTIRQAGPDGESAVSAILLEAAAWLNQRGTPMWRDSELLPERIRTDVAEGLFFLAKVGDEPAGTVKFQLSDPIFWPDAPQKMPLMFTVWLFGGALQVACSRLHCSAGQPIAR